MRRTRTVVSLLIAAFAACGEQSRAPPPPPPYALQATGGAYDDGSGVLGVAVLASLRDEEGSGPAVPWTGTLADGTGPRETVTYADTSSGSYVAMWWPELPFASGNYALALSSGQAAAPAFFTIADGSALTYPSVSVSPDGATLSWNGVPGVVLYECRISNDAGLVRSSMGPGTTCAVDDLPFGSYRGSVIAYSADLVALAGDFAQRPTLPARFDVAEGRVSFLRSDASVVVASAIGGAIDYGLGERTLAVWVSIINSDGTPNPNAWSIALTGPGIESSAPITFTYPGNFSRLLVWSYEQPASPGIYMLTATSAAGTLNVPFSVGAPAWLALPTDITAADGALGSARVDWTAVPQARSYLVSVWQGATFVTSQWVSSPPADFPPASFTAGQLYEVYIAATDADMVAGGRPARVAVAENTLQPAGFVAR